MVQSALLVALFIPTLTFAAATQPTDSQPPATTDTGFVPLTHFPQIQSLAQSQGFGTFVNTLYKILIGAGAVLAVIMIMVAGVQFMTSRGSVASNEKAKSRIQNALLGLLLILSPVIVFGIINPSILQLNLGNEFGGLKQDHGINQDAFSSSPNPALSAQQCSTAKNQTIVPIPPGKTSSSVCSAKGSGWASYDLQCCSTNDSSQACCAYDPANVGTPSAPQNPDNGTGNFYYDYVQQSTDDNGKACTTGVQSRRFDTSAACKSNAATAESGTAIRNDCSSTETYSPSQQQFNLISALPTCPK